MKPVRSRTRCAVCLVALLAVPTLSRADDAAPPAPSPAQAVANQPPPSTAVFVRPLDEQGHAAAVAAPPPSTGPTIDSVLSIMRKLGAISLSALVMLFGSALAGVLIAGLVLLVRKRRDARTAA